MASNDRTFGDMLRDLRTESGRTLGQVARHLNVSVSYVSDVEHGRRLPFEPKQIGMIAQLCGVNPSVLLTTAAIERQSVKISSDSDEVLEVAAGLAHRLDRGDPAALMKLRALLQELEAADDQ